MDNGLEKRYGLLTAIAMVVGIVIGSGVFFKAEKVLTATGGNLSLGILAWLLGGLVMILCAYNFALMATKHEKVSGVVDYAEVLVGGRYAYFFAWFAAVIYFHDIRCGVGSGKIFRRSDGLGNRRAAGYDVIRAVSGGQLCHQCACAEAGRQTAGDHNGGKADSFIFDGDFRDDFRLEKRDSGREFYNNGSAYLYE